MVDWYRKVRDPSIYTSFTLFLHWWIVAVGPHNEVGLTFLKESVVEWKQNVDGQLHKKIQMDYWLHIIKSKLLLNKFLGKLNKEQLILNIVTSDLSVGTLYLRGMDGFHTSRR